MKHAVHESMTVLVGDRYTGVHCIMISTFVYV